MIHGLRNPMVPCSLAILVISSGASSSLLAQNRTIGVDSTTGEARAVVVEDLALVHTTQLFPCDDQGRIGDLTLEGQVNRVVANLKSTLADAGAKSSDLVRMNVYVTRNELVGQAREVLAETLLRESHPAVTYAVTRLPDEAALVAIDAIASTDRQPKQVVRLPGRDDARCATARAAILPRGRVVYISGMAAQESDLAGSARKTMEQLHGVLGMLGLDAAHVVHLKAFMKPASEAAAACKAMHELYPQDQSAPPMTFVEWSNGLPIEIEMIAFIPGDPEPGQTVAHRWPPEEQRSPVYCRFAVVDAPVRIYVSGLQSRKAIDAEGQVRDIFTQLRETLAQADSDFLHMVKATYYVADDAVSRALNEVRPELYDPQRPPAASKASIAGTGDGKRTITMDMIAVPK